MRSLSAALSLLACFAAGPIEAQNCAKSSPPVNQLQTIPKPPPEFQGTHKDQSVVLDLFVELNGTPTVDRIVSSPGRNYSAAAVSAVKLWSYLPGRCDGKEVRMRITVTVTFEHERSQS